MRFIAIHTAQRAEHDRLMARGCHTQVDVSSDEEPMVRPNIGRHVVARTDGAEGTCCRVHGATNPGVMEVTAETVHTTVEASPTHDDRGYRCMETVQDNSEHDFEGTQTQVIVPASSAALRAAGLEERATDSEDEQNDQRTLLDEDTCSDTVSLVGQRNSG